MDLATYFIVHRSHGDSKDALAPLQQINDLLWARCSVDGGSITQEGDVLFTPLLPYLLLQLLKRGADLVETGTCILEAFDNAECHDIAKGVQPLCTGTGRLLH